MVLLSQERDWLAIDPKGVIGEVAYEVGAFIRNPMPSLLDYSSMGKLLQHRLEFFSEQLTIDKVRLKEWSYVQAILAACWALEDGGDPQRWIVIAESIGI